jgi:hypothetical protein
VPLLETTTEIKVATAPSYLMAQALSVQRQYPMVAPVMDATKVAEKKYLNPVRGAAPETLATVMHKMYDAR